MGGLREFASSDMDTSELSNHHELEDNLQVGDVFIGDRLYSGYELIERLHSKGVHFIGRTHQARKIDFRRGKKIGPDERLVVWKKSRKKPKGSHLSEEEWEALPEAITVRLIRCQGPDRTEKRGQTHRIHIFRDRKKGSNAQDTYFYEWIRLLT